MVKICAYCDKQIVWPDIFNCYYCQKQYCDEHYLAQNHECPKVKAAEHIEKNWLRKKGQDITSGMYLAVCKQCGYKSKEPFEIEYAEKFRQIHINMKGCDAQQVVLREYEEDKKDDTESSEIPPKTSSFGKNLDTEWLYDMLKIAQSIINTHHLDQTEFFTQCNFRFRFDQEANDAFGYVGGTYPDYIIGIHKLFSKPSDEDKRFVTMTIVHELLHIIHSKWSESEVVREEYRLANLAGYFDTLQRRDSGYLARRKNLDDLE